MTQDDRNRPVGGRRATVAAPAPSGSRPDMLAQLAERAGVPAIDIQQIAFPLTNLDLIPVEIAKRQCVLPVLIREDAIFLAMGDPSERRVIEELEFVSGKRVFPYVAPNDELVATIDRAYRMRDHGETNFRGPDAPSSEPSKPPGMTGVSARSGTGPVRLPSTPAMPAVSMAPEAIDLGDDDLADPDLRPSNAPQSASKPQPTLDSVFTDMQSVRGQTVLIVDDEEDIRRLLKRVLTEKGFKVLEADRGSVALAMVKQHVPDAIVLDAMLPELHGFDICRRIKASARYGHIPILMISAIYRGWRFAEDLKQSYGVNAFIEKPFRLTDVVTTLEGLLAGVPKSDNRDPESLTAEAEGALTAGMAAYKAGDLDSAVAHLERGIGLDPLSYRLHYHLALLVGRKGDVFRAIQELETAINLNPQSFAALKNLAVLYQKAGFKNKAIEMWERAIPHSPDDETRGQIKEHLMSLL